MSLLTSLLPVSSSTQPDPTRLRRRATDKAPTEQRIREHYQRPRSFTNLLPWVEYDPDAQVFLLDDGVSVAALFELFPIGAEARTQDYLEALRDRLQTVLTSLPERNTSPWIVQLYLQDQASLGDLAQSIHDYVHPRAKHSALTTRYLQTLEQHLADISQSGGLFVDTQVTGNPWRGQRRRIRCTLYRRTLGAGPKRYGQHHTPEQELNEVCDKLVTAFAAAGVRTRRCGGRELYTWMLAWFNPAPLATNGDAESLHQVAPYPGDTAMPYGFDFAESLMLGMPHSDHTEGIWWFDGLPHTIVTIANLRAVPEIGVFGAERAIGDHVYAVFDRCPENTILVMTITIRAQDEVRNQLSQIQRAAVGDSPEATLAGHDADAAQMQIAKGNKLFPVQLAFYVRGETLTDLHRHVNSLHALLLSHQIQPIRETDDVLALDSYVRNLPMNYQHQFDQRIARRSRLVFSNHAANLMPLYGRSVGTGNPGILMYNRGAEPMTFDPLNAEDRKKNAHLLLIGPTGSGKSATLVYLILQMLAIYRPRVFIIEVGGSFELLGKYLAAHQVSVNQVTLTPATDISLPPFSDALTLLDEVKARQQDRHLKSTERLLEEDLDDQDDASDDSNRDRLGEMEIAARIMITGGDPREDNRLTRPDRLLIRQAILLAAQQVKDQQREQVLTEDVVAALRQLPDLTENRRERAQEMADAMALFCDGLGGHFFNRPGQRWPNRDVTIVDMGILAREGYEDQLTVAYIGLMNHIHDLVERHQNDARPTLVITDEGHIITTNPLLSPYVIKIVKMWRKLGTWFWIATQSLEDFPDQSKKMLSMLEWWICLVMEKDDLEHIARFKNLSDEQHGLLLAARKSPGQYTEGVVFSADLAALFRNVPPALALALGMTEKDEKAQRQQLMREHDCTELEAVYKMAESIAAQRRRGA